MKLRLTDRAVRAKKPPKIGQAEYWDTVCKGLALRVSYAGTKSWTVMARLHGVQRRWKLGQFPELTLADARAKAREYKVSAAAGRDPTEAETRAREAAARDQLETFAAVVDRYTEERLGTLSRGLEVEQTLRRELLPHWKHRPIRQIERRDVKRLIAAKAIHHPTAANRLLASTRAFFNWCLDEEIIETSPAARIKAPAKETERERVLSDDEIKAIWTACADFGPYGHMVQLLLTTAQRRSEVAGMRWDEIDIGNATWTIPAERTKRDKGHLLPLSSLALEILATIPRVGDYVVSPTGTGPFQSFGYPKAKLDKASGVTDWVVHDLRRTAATKMRSLGVDRLVVSSLLNHAESGVTKIYDRFADDEGKRHALERWGAELSRIIDGRKTEKVVPLHGGPGAALSA